jgi:p-aminobenzoyl-glutamate transporter AbgT
MISLFFALSLISRAMKYFLILTSALFFLTLSCFAQKKAAEPGLPEVRIAYDRGKYQEALSKLGAAEKGLKTPGPELLYLKILVQKALLPPANDPAFYNHMDQFDKLENLRDNCKKYLILYLSAGNADGPKQKKVQQIQQSLKDYPVAKVQFDEIMHLRNSQKKHTGN